MTNTLSLPAVPANETQFATEGDAERVLEPSEVTLTVNIQGKGDIQRKGDSRISAFARFQERVKTLVECLGDQTHHSLSTIREEEAVFGTTKQTTVSATATIHLNLSNFGEVLIALLKARFQASDPQYKFPNDSGSTVGLEELYEEAAANARRTAEAIGKGAGFSVGGVLGVGLGALPRVKDMPASNPSTLWDWTNVNHSLFLNNSLTIFGRKSKTDQDENLEIDPQISEMLNSSVPLKSVSVKLHVTFKILPAV